MLCLTRIRPGAAAVAALLCLGVAAAAQQLPPAPAPIPPIRRGADGRIELAPPVQAPAIVTKAPKQQPETRSAPSAAAPSAPAPPTQVVPPPAGKADISLPEPLALELPGGEVAPGKSAIEALLDRARSDGRKITYELEQPIRLGPQRIAFTAWEGAPRTSAVAATKKTTLFVMPRGITPVGLSGDGNATGGNNTAKIARDAAGRVHLVWLDAGRAEAAAKVLYRRATVTPDGTVQWETDPIRVDDAQSEAWNAYPGLAVSENTVHVVWQAGGTARYRHMPVDGSAGDWGPVHDTSAVSQGADIGPAIAASAGLIHIATSGAFDAVSRDGGVTWKTERIPLPNGQRSKSVSVALDRSRNAHFAMSAVVYGPREASTEKASHGYWELRYIRRSPAGIWSDAGNVLAGAPGWAEPQGEDDVLSDWVRLLADDGGNLHVTWHGSAESRVYGRDLAYYVRRGANGTGWQAAWDTPISLLPANTLRNGQFSFAPSLALDRETAIAVPFYDVADNGNFRGFDTAARVITGGKLAGEPVKIAQWVRSSIDAGTPDAALSARFPAAAPYLYRDPQGRVWLDLLETLIPQDGPKLIVYQRVELTERMRR